MMLTLPRLNAIVDVETAERAGWAPVDLAAACVSGGARFLQIRAKSLSGAAFLDLAARVCEIAHRAGALVIVNDRADIACLSGADGVHVGQDDLSCAAVRAMVGRDAIVGLSTHTAAQVDAALEAPITYIALGPVFGTSTKATGYSAVGLDRVREVAEQARRMSATTATVRPVGFSRRRSARLQPSEHGSPEGSRYIVAIGGVTLENAPLAIQAGATSVAVITDLLATGDPETRVAAYLARLGETGNV
jgi:thiamine-phosphate pyrophosphorylase